MLFDKSNIKIIFFASGFFNTVVLDFSILFLTVAASTSPVVPLYSASTVPFNSKSFSATGYSLGTTAFTFIVMLFPAFNEILSSDAGSIKVTSLLKSSDIITFEDSLFFITISYSMVFPGSAFILPAVSG